MRVGRGFALSLGSGALAVLVAFLLRLFFGAAYLPEMAAQTLFSLVPGAVESQAVENLGPLAKESAFVGASILNAFLFALVPYGLRRLGFKPEKRYIRIALFTLAPYAIMFVLGLIFISIAQVASQPPSVGALVVGLIPSSIVFGGIAGYRGVFVRTTAAKSGRGVVCLPESGLRLPYSRKRRLFIKSAIATAVGATILYYGVGLLFSKGQEGNISGEASSILSAKVTPNDGFYRVDVNVIAPTVDASGWSLNLHGLVNTPIRLTYDQLVSLPSVEEYATLECVSNKVGGDLMSTAIWKGVRLREMLDRAGVNPAADYVVFRCYDGYDVGVPLDRSLMDGTILAYEMNGTKLPNEHGYPVRAIVPGLYGMMNAKWVTEIELVNKVYAGFWQRRGWTNNALYQTGSTILSPGDSHLRDRFPIPSNLTDVSGNPLPFLGVAFAGDRGISKVEVSTDEGNSWETATLYDRQSNYTWVFWKLSWNPPASGTYKLMVRATDKTGQVQTATMRTPFPSGASGYQVVDIRVSNA